MKDIGSKISNIRKSKGLSQEELAQEAGVNLRTIQRIEKGDCEPRGKTLHLICQVLDIRAEDILDYGKKPDTRYLMFLHLSVISFLVIPVGNILLPLILWITGKDRVAELQETGARLLNFQILWTAVSFLCFSFLVAERLMFGNLSGNWLVAYFVFRLLNVALAVFYAIRIRNGHVQATYPQLMTLVR